MKQHNSKFSLLNGSEFEKCRRVLQSKQKQLESSGYGNKPNASDELTDTDKLFQHGLLGVHAPLPLINLLHFTLSCVLGMRGGKEQRDHVLSDIEIGCDSSKKEYLCLRTERQTKTRQGNNPNDIKKNKN